MYNKILHFAKYILRFTKFTHSIIYNLCYEKKQNEKFQKGERSI